MVYHIDHIANYKSIIQIQDTYDEVMPLAFSMTFEKGVQNWYNKL